MNWAVPPEPRDQLVLFPSKLDEVVPQEHLVRDLDAILRELDWSEFKRSITGRWGLGRCIRGSPCLTHPGRPVTSTCRRVR